MVQTTPKVRMWLLMPVINTLRYSVIGNLHCMLFFDKGILLCTSQTMYLTKNSKGSTGKAFGTNKNW
jgi:hypothetical protein